MNVVVLVGDGMGDYPVPDLGNRTPLRVARIPMMRRLASAGEIVRLQTVPAELPPGSDVANLSLLGYDPRRHYGGRAPIEAAGNGLLLRADDVAFRCNLVHIDGGVMKDYSAGHIGTEEARALIASLQEALGGEGLAFHPGVSYRHLVVWSNGPAGVETTPPHEIQERPVAEYLPRGDGAVPIRRLMESAQLILRDHPVNRARRAAGSVPASHIWLWGQGRAMCLPKYADLFGRKGIVVSAVDLVRGLGILAGLKAPVIEGATGFLDTNCENKVAAALRALDDGDFAYVHLEAPDECGHMGRPDLKVQAIEMFDLRIVGPIWRALEVRNEPYRLVVTMDHHTPVSKRGHTREPVPAIVVSGPTGSINKEKSFDEFCADSLKPVPAHEWIASLLSK